LPAHLSFSYSLIIAHRLGVAVESDSASHTSSPTALSSLSPAEGVMQASGSDAGTSIGVAVGVVIPVALAVAALITAAVVCFVRRSNGPPPPMKRRSSSMMAATPLEQAVRQLHTNDLFRGSGKRTNHLLNKQTWASS
jgi:hypothetical protein